MHTTCRGQHYNLNTYVNNYCCHVTIQVHNLKFLPPTMLTSPLSYPFQHNSRVLSHPPLMTSGTQTIHPCDLYKCLCYPVHTQHTCCEVPPPTILMFPLIKWVFQPNLLRIHSLTLDFHSNLNLLRILELNTLALSLT